MPASGTEQFTAILSGGSTNSVTWEVNGTAGGSLIDGTISANGLYTAPSVPPITEPVTIMATADGVSATASATIGFSNTSLNGQYVFTFDEINSGAETGAVGLVTLDGAGDVTGTEDLNGPSGVFNAVSVAGNYSVSGNGQGTLTLDGGSAGTLSLTLSLVVGAAEGILTDNTAGRVGGGDLYPVTGSVSSLSNVNGNYAISLGSGPVASSNNSIGLLSLSGGSITSGSLDENNNGNYLQNNSISGSYTVGSGNRGTLTLTIGAQTSDYVFYAVSPDQLQLIGTDAGTISSGNLDTQTSQAVAAGAYVFQLTGAGTGQMPDAFLASVTLGSSSPTGGAATLTMYENDNGNYQSTIGSSTYTVDTSGRGLMTIPTPVGSRNFVFYVQAVGTLNMLETSSGFGNITGSPLAVQNNAGAVAGQYVLLMASQAPSSLNLGTVQAILQVTVSGQVTGEETLDIDGVISTVPVTGTLAAQKTSGVYILTLNLGGGQIASYMMVANAQGILSGISTDTTEVSAGGMIIQYVTQ
ncbi:MAG: hypothetical protein ACYDCJ_03075 [Gammaproteobacteria bacterium]